VNGLLLLKLTTVLPNPKLPLRLMPSCLIKSRSTSATVTFNMIWSRARTMIALTTLLPAPTASAEPILSSRVAMS
jgi:hypothetical protein